MNMKLFSVIALLMLTGIFVSGSASANPYHDGNGGWLLMHDGGSWRYCEGGVCVGCYDGAYCHDVPGNWQPIGG